MPRSGSERPVLLISRTGAAKQLCKCALCRRVLSPQTPAIHDEQSLMPVVKSKAMATPAKSKAQGGEVDYKAKIDAVMEAFTAKVTRGPAPCTLCALHPAPVTDLEP